MIKNKVQNMSQVLFAVLCALLVSNPVKADFFDDRDKDLDRIEKSTSCLESMAIIDEGKVILGSSGDVAVYGVVADKCLTEYKVKFGASDKEVTQLTERAYMICSMQMSKDGMDNEGTLAMSVLAGCETDFYAGQIKRLSSIKK